MSGIFLTASELGVPHVTERVAQKVEAEHHHENGQTGEDGDPWRRRAMGSQLWGSWAVFKLDTEVYRGK